MAANHAAPGFFPRTSLVAKLAHGTDCGQRVSRGAAVTNSGGILLTNRT